MVNKLSGKSSSAHLAKSEAMTLERMGRSSGKQFQSPPGDFFGYNIEEVSGDCYPLSPTPKSRKTSQPPAKVDQDMSLPNSSRLKTSTDSDSGLGEEDDAKMYDDFDIEGVSKEEMAFWSQLAPAGQKLTDVETSPVKLQPKTDRATCTY